MMVDFQYTAVHAAVPSPSIMEGGGYFLVPEKLEGISESVTVRASINTTHR